MKWLKFAAPGVNEKTEKPSPDLRYIGLEDVESWTGRLLDGEDYSPESTSNLFKAGDVLFGKLRPYLAKIFQASKEGVCSSEFFVLRPKSVKSDFLKYYLLTQEFVGLVNSSTFGAKMPRASWEFMGHLPLVIPPEEEQRKIAQFLDYQTAKIDRLIAKQQRLIELMEEKRQAVISEVVTKGLDHDALLKDSGIDWLGCVPRHWTISRLKFLGKVHPGLAKGRDYKDQDTVELPYLRVANVQDGALDLTEVKTIEVLPSEVERFSLQYGDILMNEGGDYDKLGRGTVWHAEIEPCLHQNHVFAFRPYSSSYSYWIAWITSAHYAKHFFILNSKQTTNLASISRSAIEELPVVMPPEEEREKILHHLADRVRVFDQMNARARDMIRYLREQRESLISLAVTGKIDVRGWQPPKTEPEEFDTTEALNG
jgi:type I restriction enzyme S subunit